MSQSPGDRRRWIVLFSGFTEREGQAEPCGVERLANLLRRTPDCRGWEIEFRPWTADTAGLAARIAHDAGPMYRYMAGMCRTVCQTLDMPFSGIDSRVSIVVAGYSWGGGWAARHFAWRCWEQSLPIATLCLADPVYRSPRPWLRWRSVFPPPRPPRGPWPPGTPAWRRTLERWAWTLGRPFVSWAPKLVIPSNVREVVSWRQSRALPMGHDLEAVDPQATRIEPPRDLSRLHHGQIDESPHFWAGVAHAVSEANRRAGQ